jgi:peptidoglycan L-alanyl-D-glutamate endopeptidase CwlK
MFYHDRNMTALDGLDDVARERFGVLLERLEAVGEDVLFTDGRRFVWEQNAKYAQGRDTPGPIVTDARGDESFHVWGVAIDLVPVGMFGQTKGSLVYGAADRYRAIAQIALELGIDWGIVLWKKDAPHFQYTQGLTIEDFRQGKRLYPVHVAPTREELEQRLLLAQKALGRASPRRRLLLARFIKRAAQLLRGV